MIDARVARARWALVVSFCTALVVACGSSSDPGAGDGTADDAGPASVVGDGGGVGPGPSAVEGGAAPTDAATTPTRDSSTTQPHGGCGLTLKGSRWNLTCQQWMNANCCSEQLACANDAACKALVDCIGACKGQNTDACVNTCEQNNSGGMTLLNPMGACSKTPPADGGAAIPTKCSWP